MATHKKDCSEESADTLHRLNIGCGDRPTPGWTNYDNSLTLLLGKIPVLPSILMRLGIVTSRQLGFIAIGREWSIRYVDAAKRIPDDDCSVDRIYCCHMLEHLQRPEALRFLQECYRVLKPSGAIRVVVPDLKILASVYNATGDADRFLESLYIFPESPVAVTGRIKNALFGLRLHLWMYDADSLIKLLLETGFKDPVSLPAGYTTISNLGAIDLNERSEESLYVEAFKS